MKRVMRKVLLVYPEFPISFWGLQYAIEFIGKKSNVPLGLLTIAGMLPKDSYEIKLIDMNVTSLRNEHITCAALNCNYSRTKSELISCCGDTSNSHTHSR